LHQDGISFHFMMKMHGQTTLRSDIGMLSPASQHRAIAQSLPLFV